LARRGINSRLREKNARKEPDCRSGGLRRALPKKSREKMPDGCWHIPAGNALASRWQEEIAERRGERCQ
ncbi:MAG TPA: hypothetical protein VEK75_10655, partial [Xanthobacteraceae bacterium]|nr:hypothetical protein [Xanthobacteraceae bacterium]